MTAWLEIFGVLLLTLLGVFLGWLFSKLPGRYWTIGYFLAAVPVAMLWFGRTYSQWELVAPFSWVCAGRTKFALVGLLATMLLIPPLTRVSNPRLRALVLGFLVIFIGSNAFWPFISPALSRKHLSLLVTRYDRNGICLQNTDYTCGPAASVTALKRLGLPAEEGELAVLAHTSNATGTPPDILWRTLRSRYAGSGLQCDYRHFRSIDELRNGGITIAVIKFGPLVDHYVTVLEVTDTTVTVGDPLKGKVEFTRAEFSKEWRYLGIVLRRGVREMFSG
jgi:hypothetical protein